jgi:hypothetical protein
MAVLEGERLWLLCTNRHGWLTFHGSIIRSSSLGTAGLVLGGLCPINFEVPFHSYGDLMI